MLKGIAPKDPGSCDTPIDKILAFGQEENIRGTPTLFLANGHRVVGAVPADQLEKVLDSAR